MCPALIERLETATGGLHVTVKIAALILSSFLILCETAHAIDDHASVAYDIFKQLIEINTTDSVGSVSKAAEALAQRLLRAGFPAKDILVLGPSERKKNLVVRLHGTGQRRPVLFIGHLDVVEAPRVDWATDPFELVEKAGYFYGRGTLDMKSSDAIAVATLIRLRNEGFKPHSDIILALTSGEESFKDNGVKWLLEHHRDLIDAEFVINMDGIGVLTDHGRPVTVRVDAAEKLYADFRLTVINPGGTTALPARDNAIYRLSAGLTRLEQYRFPFELNPVTRAYLTQLAEAAEGPRRADLLALLADSPDPAALDRVSRDALDNATLHTVCSATRLEAGHANNALPQMASAMVNCRILPGHSAEEVRKMLLKVLDDPKIMVSYVREFDGQVSDRAPDAVAMPAGAPRPDVVGPLKSIAHAFWPGAPVIAGMSVGESDAVWTAAAGMPTIMVSGLAVDRDDVRVHGRDERLRVSSFNQGIEFFYQYLKAIAIEP
jgi:acetylornithine deacetylase/succinyl-diaminopimelate desuccinylase-like protein